MRALPYRSHLRLIYNHSLPSKMSAQNPTQLSAAVQHSKGLQSTAGTSEMGIHSLAMVLSNAG